MHLPMWQVLAKKGSVLAGMSWGMARCDGAWSGCGEGVGRAEGGAPRV